MTNIYSINFVAGGGKTTKALELAEIHKNHIYVSFTNSVADEAESRGIKTVTLHNFYYNFIFKKIKHFLKIFKGCEIKFKVPSKNKGSYDPNRALNKLSFPEQKINIFEPLDHPDNIYAPISLVKAIKSKEMKIKLRQLVDIIKMLNNEYPDAFSTALENSYELIIIDEAQDIQKEFSEVMDILFLCSNNALILGDVNQNVNQGSDYFERLIKDEVEIKTYRSPEGICSFITSELDIKMESVNENIGEVIRVPHEEVLDYNNGKTVLIYKGNSGIVKKILPKWKGPHSTVGKIKGATVEEDIVVLGGSLSVMNVYTAITRTTKNCYLSSGINKK